MNERERPWRFAGFEYSAERGLERSGVAVALQPKVRGLLEMLLRARGATVSKEAIAGALWPSEAASDDSISRVAHQLRRALGGDSATVRTIYGVGLRLEARIDGPAPANPQENTEIIRVVQEIAAARTGPGLERAKGALRATLRTCPEQVSGWTLLADITASQVLRGYLAPDAAASEIADFAARALAHSPRNARALAVSGWALALLGGRKAAGLKRLDEAIAVGSDWIALYYRAWLDAEARDLAAATERIEAALRQSPIERTLLSLQARLALCAGRTGEADALAREALKLHPEVDILLFVRSIAAGLRSDWTASIAHARAAVELSERSPVGLSVLAWALARAGRRAEARAALDEVVAAGRRPSHLAPALQALGDVAGAKALLRDARAQRCPWRAFAWCDPRNE